MPAFTETVDPMSNYFDWRLLFRLEREVAELSITSVHHFKLISFQIGCYCLVTCNATYEKQACYQTDWLSRADQFQKSELHTTLLVNDSCSPAIHTIGL